MCMIKIRENVSTHSFVITLLTREKPGMFLYLMHGPKYLCRVRDPSNRASDNAETKFNLLEKTGPLDV